MIKLNEEQKRAVETIDGYVRVIAGAGSGKTKALTERYVWLVEGGCSPQNILCVTFTNKAAAEMKKRIRKRIGEQDVGFVCTFHGFCVKFLKEEYASINFPKAFSILDEDDVKGILKELVDKWHYDVKQKTIDQLYKEIFKTLKKDDAYVSFLTSPSVEGLTARIQNEKNLELKILYDYLLTQRNLFSFDFEDLIYITLYVLKTRPDICEKWQERLWYIMVDEYQDVSGPQAELATILSKKHKNLFVVGDPDQTIYSWRGANIKYIMEFPKNHAPCECITMNKNYRSLPKILRAANSLIKRNVVREEKDLISMREDGRHNPIYFHAKSVDEEAKWIADQITALNAKQYDYSKIAILYRAKSVTRAVEEAFYKAKIPYIICDGNSFYKRTEIKNALAFLRLIAENDNLAFSRVINVPAREFGKKKREQVEQYASENECSYFEALDALKKNYSPEIKSFVAMIKKLRKDAAKKSIWEMLNKVLDESGYEEYLRRSGEEERLDNLAELKLSIKAYENANEEFANMNDYLEQVSLINYEEEKDEKNRVRLMTIHSAKGLEFPVVFVCSMNEGVFPSSNARSNAQMEEERRLAYVAYTRAEDKLFISDAEGKTANNRERYPSRFIFDIPERELNYLVALPADLIARTRNYLRKILSSFGSTSTSQPQKIKLMNKLWGAGEVIAKENEDSYLVKYEKWSDTRRVNLEHIEKNKVKDE